MKKSIALIHLDSLPPLGSLLSTIAAVEVRASTVLSNLLKALSLTTCSARDALELSAWSADRDTKHSYG